MTMMLFSHRGLREFLGEDPVTYFKKRKICYEPDTIGFNLTIFKKSRSAVDRFDFPFEAEAIDLSLKELQKTKKKA